MAAVTATFSERNPVRIGMTKRAFAAAWTSASYAGRFAPEQENVVWVVTKIQIGQGPGGCEQEETATVGPAPRFKIQPRPMPFHADGIEVVHAGAAEGTVAHRKARRFDNMGFNVEARAKAQNGSRVLWNIGLVKGDPHRINMVARLRLNPLRNSAARERGGLGL